ncbi:unnamed protein product [Gongylonema pulchrum]|uniref:Fibronectin type-III domain-containing protein n=1 Tax=Gongylonema pulchrum TaxID=637853 RepID=A0A183DTL2_9BILA|nr:unnamed protein product [Gongylonema pulchrum]
MNSCRSVWTHAQEFELVIYAAVSGVFGENSKWLQLLSGKHFQETYKAEYTIPVAAMWNEPNMSYPEMESAYRPIPARQRRLPRFLLPYARPPPEVPAYLKPNLNIMRMPAPIPFPLPGIPLDIPTPHATGPGLSPSSLRSPRSNVPLYQDFCAPSRPLSINITVQTSALKCLIEWKPPALDPAVMYVYKLEVWEGIRCDTYDFPPHIFSFELKTTPGALYKLELSARDVNNSVVAVGTTCMKAGLL